MIVYNLACEHRHPFEGWFGSPADFENQRDGGLVECPVCGSNAVERKLHAPRINVGAQQTAPRAGNEAGVGTALAARNDAPAAITAATGEIDFEKVREAMVTFAEKVRESTEYVGEKFADEARAMHYGEKPHKGIRGRADQETAQALREEGITFQSLPFPVDFPKTH